MTSGPEPTDRWSQLSSLLDALLDTPPERRTEVIAELSGGDPARRAELERLLADIDRESPLIDAPVAERFGALLEDPAAAGFPEVLADRYRLSRELGRGGMATVYLARDLRHGRDVAVKVVSPMLASALGGDRFLREIEIVANLRHPHIVPLFDSGNAGGAPYYVMPFETGLSLRQRLARDGPLPIDDAVTILRDVSDALAHAHERGIVHRDIKPDNVMLSRRRWPWRRRSR
jgi:eukaryotic-like serine/threonine-protein kinase